MPKRRKQRKPDLQPHERLRAWRKGRELDQAYVSRGTRIAQSALSLIERGKQKPSLAQAFAIELFTGGAIVAKEWLGDGLNGVRPADAVEPLGSGT